MKKTITLLIIVLLLSVSAAMAQKPPAEPPITPAKPPKPTTQPQIPPIDETLAASTEVTVTRPSTTPTRPPEETAPQRRGPSAPRRDTTKPPRGAAPPQRPLSEVQVRAVSDLAKAEAEIASYLQRGLPPPPELQQKRQNLIRIINLPAEQFEQFGSVAQAFQTFVGYYQQFSGLAGWSSLILDGEALQSWRDTVNSIMCDTLHLPTKDCWTSKICGAYSDITPSRDGILFSTPIGGAPQAVGHIEGQRSMPIVLPNGTLWGYTVTFGLTNPADEDISYNVRFSGQRDATWWSSDQTIGGGGSANALGAAALYKISATDYGSVCLTFSPSITAFGGKRVSEICNDIVQYAGGATAPYPGPAAPEAAPGAAPTTPAEAPPGANV